MLRAPEQLRRVEHRVSLVLNWHTASQRGRSGRGVTLCTECGQPYPCRTRLMLLGEEDRAQVMARVRLR